jgi:hypothetical protein
LLERKVPALSDRRFDVLPETLAPLVSLCMDPRVAPGLYLAIDMGAGTTELSVSYLPRYSSNAADRRITFYSDRSTRLGGDMFEANDRRHAGEPAARALGDEALRESLRTEMRMVWYEGFQKFMRGGCKRRSRSAAPAGREAWRSVPSDLSRAAPPSRPELGPLLLR